MADRKLIPCPQHPGSPIDAFINISPYFKGRRFHCSQCLLEVLSTGEPHKNFIEGHNLIKDAKSLFSSKKTEKSLFDKFIHQYDALLDKDVEKVQIQYIQLLEDLKTKVVHTIDQLKADFKERLGSFGALIEQIKKSKEVLNTHIGLSDLKQAYDKVQPSENVTETADWKQLEKSLNDLLLKTQTNDDTQFAGEYKACEDAFLKMIVACVKIPDEIAPKLAEIQKLVKTTEETVVKLFPRYIATDLCPPEFQEVLQPLINYPFRSLQLVYKSSVHEKTSDAFWTQVKGKSATLFLFKLTNDQLIGAYAPVPLIPNGQWIPDTQGQSFIFSTSKKQIYPIKQGKSATALLGQTNGLQILYFGPSDLFLNGQFQLQSTLNNAYDIKDLKDVVPNQHLFNGPSGIIAELEVYAA